MSAPNVNSAVVRISQENGEMARKVKSMGFPPMSEAGAKWLMKALHPADPTEAGVQMPDGTAGLTVPMQIVVTQQVVPSAEAGGNWDCTLSLIPHPTCLCCVEFDAGASSSPDYTIRSPLFKATTANDDLFALLAQAEAWRLTHMSLTAHLDATATTNSGTVVAGQYAVRPRLLIPGGNAVGSNLAVHAPVLWHEPADRPSYDQLAGMPDMYYTNALEGVYIPLRLSQTSQHWKCARDMVGLTASTKVSYDSVPGGLTFGNSVWVGVSGVPSWPNVDLSPSYMRTDSGTIVGGNMSSYLGDNFGRAIFKNLNPAAGIATKLIIGLELKVQPGSTQLPHARPAPPVDPVALQTYFAIVNQLAAAYPAYYNDGAKILRAISSAVKAFAPGIATLFPTAAPMVAAGTPMVTGFLEKSANRLEKRKNRKKKGAYQKQSIGNGITMQVEKPRGPPPALPPRTPRK